MFTYDQKKKRSHSEGGRYVPKLLTTDGTEVLVDQDILEKYDEYKWSISKRGDVLSWQPIHGKRGLFLRKLVLGETKRNIHIRHINGDKLDCRRENLSRTNLEFKTYEGHIIATIPGKTSFLIDEQEKEVVSKYFWSKMKCGYIYSPTLKTYLHRLLTDCPDNLYVDHANGNKLDNRRSNLRIVTNSLNQVNRPKQRNSSKRTYSSVYKGVSRTREGKFVARVKRKHLGTFSTEVAAANAYNYEAIKQFGEYVVLNDVPEIPQEKLKFYHITKGAR